MESSARTVDAQPPARRLLLACGAIGPLLFIAVFLIAGAARANYDPLRHPISSLSLGELGWMQSVNFVVTGLLVQAFAVGMRLALRGSRIGFWGPLLIGLVGIGLIGAGFFTTDPIGGYPPGTPLVATERTTHGVLHDLFSLPVFTALPAACFVFARRFAKWGHRGWSIASLLAGVGMLVTFVLAGVGFNQTPGFADIAGVFQRLSIIIGFMWIALLAVYLLRHDTTPETA